MDKKTIIKVVIIFICFGAAGFILYNGFFSSGLTTEPSTQAAASQGEILPNGTALDFDKAILPKRFEFELFQYPKLDNKEVGIPVSNLIIPEN